MIGIVFTLNIEYAPFLKKYTDILDKLNIKYEVIFWNRLNLQYQNDNYIVFNKYTPLYKPKFFKLFDFLSFKKFLNNQIYIKNYKGLILLTSLSGIILSQKNLSKYKKKYIFDVRDFTYENFILYRFLIKKLVKNSFITTISSPAFKFFLPKAKYIVSHNFDRNFIKGDMKLTESIKSIEKPEITFLGAIRHFSIDIRLISIFKNSNYQLSFRGYGKDYEKLRNFSKDYPNVNVHGKYNNSEKYIYYKNTLIINSYYSEKKIENKYAMSNKFYDAIIFKKILWANPLVYMGKLAIEKGIGLDVYLDHNSPQNIFKQIRNFNVKEFNMKCDLLLDQIIKEDDEFINYVSEFFLKI